MYHLQKQIALTTLMLILILAISPASILAASTTPEGPHPPRHPGEPRNFRNKFPRDTTSVTTNLPFAPGTMDWPASPWSKIVFESFRDTFASNASLEIYLADGFGLNDTRLTNDLYEDSNASLNRGCTQIAFDSNRNGNLEIYSMNPDGSNIIRLTTNSAIDGNPAWSPNGSQIAFQSNRDGDYEIYVMPSTGGTPTQLTFNSGFMYSYDGEPVWSPDGTKVAFTSNRNGGEYYIWVMDANGSNPVQLSTKYDSEDPAWSPDGTQIAFDADPDGDLYYELWVVNNNGSNEHEVLDGSHQDDPDKDGSNTFVESWSPDGRYIAVSEEEWTYDEPTTEWYISYYRKAWDTQGSTLISLGGTNLDYGPNWQTCDALAPVTAVSALPAYSPSAFPVTWGGADQTGAGQGLAGLTSYDVQVWDGFVGMWTNWLPGTTLTSQTYTGENGHSYYFRSRARDYAYNLEAWPAGYDATTTVDGVAPTSQVGALPEYVYAAFLVSWGGGDTGGSGLASYDVQYRDGSGGAWTDWKLATSATSDTFSAEKGDTYFFRSRARDRAGNLEAWPATADASTTMYAWKVEGQVTDHAGTPAQGAFVTSVPAFYLSPGSQADGLYIAYNANPASEYQVNFTRSGYGVLPPAKLDGAADAVFDAVLPPVNDIILDGGFESGALAPAWTPGGDAQPTLDGEPHTGEYAVTLGTFTAMITSSQLTQAVTVPLTMTSPTLSFLFRLDGAPGGESRFNLSLQEGITTTNLLTQTDSTGGWAHAWFDLSAWAGKNITLTFTTNSNQNYPIYAYLDEVSLGSAHSDVWVEMIAGTDSASIGELITYTLTYGNLGGGIASNVVLTDTLPAELEFVSSSVTPDATSPALVWELGNLPAHSEPFSITLTAEVIARPQDGNLIANTAEIRAADEIETINNHAEALTLIGTRVFLPGMMR